MKNAQLPLEHIRQAMRFLLEHVHAKEDIEKDIPQALESINRLLESYAS